MRKHYFLLIAVLAIFQLQAQTNLIAGWDGNGLTSTASKPNDVGWLNTVSASVPWQVANGSGGCRFRDYNVSGGHTGFTNESDASTVTTRQLMLRYDNNAYSASTYAFPVTLDGCSTYNFTFDYVCGGSATPPKTLTVGISTTADATGRLSSKTFTTTSSATVYRNGSYSFTTGSTSGVYYITITGDYAWFGINNLSIVKSGAKSLSTNISSISLTKVNKTAKFVVFGNNLNNDVAVAGFSGITINKNSVSKSNAQCGDSVTVTLNNSQPFTTDTIRISTDTVGGTITKKIVVNFIAPTATVSQKAFQIETGETFYVKVNSVNNTVDTLNVNAPAELTVSKTKITSADFVSGSYLLGISSSAAAGTNSEITLTNGLNTLAKITVKKINFFTRYYVTQAVSNMVLGPLSTGDSIVALTTNTGVDNQKFFFRKINVLDAGTPDTVQITQHVTYRVVRKVLTGNTGWDTDLGKITNSNADWIIADKGNGLYTYSNLANTAKVLSSDAVTADSRLYYDKTYAAGGNSEWKLVYASISTDNPALNANELKLYVQNNKLHVENALSFTVYSIQGIKVAEILNNTANSFVTLNRGAYVVKANNGVQKIIVR